jgi:hypothetical protein
MASTYRDPISIIKFTFARHSGLTVLLLRQKVFNYSQRCCIEILQTINEPQDCIKTPQSPVRHGEDPADAARKLKFLNQMIVSALQAPIDPVVGLLSTGESHGA